MGAAGCVVSKWGEFGNCNKRCGGGKKKRHRTVVKPGPKCPALSEEKGCHTQACPTDCVMGKWGKWSKCSKKCGGGKSVQKREIEKLPTQGGVPCGDTTREKPCNTSPCVADCEVGEWGTWSACSNKCGGGTKTRKREVEKAAAEGGKCGSLEQSSSCNLDPCPRDCKVTPWGAFGRCDKPCGGGRMVQKRHIVIEEENGGKGCGLLEQKKSCNVQKCTKAAKDEWNTPAAIAMRKCHAVEYREKESIHAQGRAKTRLSLMKEKKVALKDALTSAENAVTASKKNVTATTKVSDAKAATRSPAEHLKEAKDKLKKLEKRIKNQVEVVKNATAKSDAIVKGKEKVCGEAEKKAKEAAMTKAKKKACKGDLDKVEPAKEELQIATAKQRRDDNAKTKAETTTAAAKHSLMKAKADACMKPSKKATEAVKKADAAYKAAQHAQKNLKKEVKQEVKKEAKEEAKKTAQDEKKAKEKSELKKDAADAQKETKSEVKKAKNKAE